MHQNSDLRLIFSYVELLSNLTNICKLISILPFLGPQRLPWLLQLFLRRPKTAKINTVCFNIWKYLEWYKIKRSFLTSTWTSIQYYLHWFHWFHVFIKLINKRDSGWQIQSHDGIVTHVVKMFYNSSQRIAMSSNQDLFIVLNLEFKKILLSRLSYSFKTISIIIITKQPYSV